MTATENAACTCGHLITAHELTQSGRRSHCCSGDQSGPCPCEKYERAGRQVVTPCT